MNVQEVSTEVHEKSINILSQYAQFIELVPALP